MANDVTNILRIDADEARLREILEAIQQEEYGIGSIDFEKICPMPEGEDWYSWRSSADNWNTKWNAYGYKELPPYQPGSNEICFLTAWNRPEPVIRKLSAMFPDARLIHQWADEDIGQNVGEALYENGFCLEECEPIFGSNEAIEMAAEIIGTDLTSLGYQILEDGGNYVYVGTDEDCSEDIIEDQGFGGMGGMA